MEKNNKNNNHKDLNLFLIDLFPQDDKNLENSTTNLEMSLNVLNSNQDAKVCYKC